MIKKLLYVLAGKFNLDIIKLVYFWKKIENIHLYPGLKTNREVIKAFSILYYDSGKIGGTWDNTYWLGVRIWKCPLDLWVYQELIYEIRPDVIIETGTSYGGSALFLASVLDLLDKGRVITVDIVQHKVPKHERITYLYGSSTDSDIYQRIKGIIKHGEKVMVILDADHRKEHVLKELKLYSQLVTAGSYIIAEDTVINGHPVNKKHGPGPWEAVKDFLRKNKDFVVDRKREKFLLTMNKSGFLKRVH